MQTPPLLSRYDKTLNDLRAATAEAEEARQVYDEARAKMIEAQVAHDTVREELVYALNDSGGRPGARTPHPVSPPPTPVPTSPPSPSSPVEDIDHRVDPQDVPGGGGGNRKKPGRPGGRVTPAMLDVLKVFPLEGEIYSPQLRARVPVKAETLQARLYKCRRKGWIRRVGQGTYELTELGRGIVKSAGPRLVEDASG